MPINIPSAFQLGASVPIDTRMILTKQQMLNMNDNIMPAVYFAFCEADGAFYLYTKSTAQADLDPETGKFKKIFSKDGGTEGMTREQVEELIQQEAGSKEEVTELTNQLNAILENAPEDCDTFAEVAQKFEAVPNTPVTDEEIGGIFG